MRLFVLICCFAVLYSFVFVGILVLYLMIFPLIENRTSLLPPLLHPVIYLLRQDTYGKCREVSRRCVHELLLEEHELIA